ncbi:hypothetical protein ACFO5K_18710 [Nocardia halotolerans]|uniref:Secreted protein n=1 Tax=Nocardia halotolerans TaxID=1755878 RepID=A0ABV8VKH8_9NOCA
MQLSHYAMIVTGATVAAAGLAGCGSDEERSTASITSSAAMSTTAPKLLGTSAAPLPAPSPGHPPAPAPEKLSDVDCGPVTGANGANSTVIAFAGDAGRPGCTEAITVATHYLAGQHTGDATAVDGWTCEPQPDPAIAHICVKGGLTIGLRGAAAPASPPPPAPAPHRTVDPNTPPTPGPVDHPPAPAPAATVPDVNCGPVTDAGGGTRHVIAVGTDAGRVGCTEAVTVASEYVRAVSDTDVATIDGWNCNAQPDATTPSVCTKDGLVIGLRAD